MRSIFDTIGSNLRALVLLGVLWLLSFALPGVVGVWVADGVSWVEGEWVGLDASKVLLLGVVVLISSLATMALSLASINVALTHPAGRFSNTASTASPMKLPRVLNSSPARVSRPRVR